jgi:transketolase
MVSSTLLELQLRLLEQCKRYSKSHLGSAFSTLPILLEIYEQAEFNDRVVLSNGHSATSLYVTLERFRNVDSNFLFENMGDHPKRDLNNGIHCSTGSLGMGITVAVGMALADQTRKVFCVISDGECAEGSVWESLRFLQRWRLRNIKIYVNLNGWSAYDAVDSALLERNLRSVYPEIEIRQTSIFPFETEGLRAHYLKMDDELYAQAKERLCAQSL